MLTQSMIFTAFDIWEVSCQQWSMERKDLSRAQYAMHLFAQQLFMLQHALFVGQYVRVALALPYIFTIQSDSVRAKRKQHMCQVTSGEILFCLY